MIQGNFRTTRIFGMSPLNSLKPPITSSRKFPDGANVLCRLSTPANFLHRDSADVGAASPGLSLEH